MACFKPLTAWQGADRTVRFHEDSSAERELKLPCGRCIGCRLTRSRSWAIRNVHESKMHKDSLFVTLTYDDKHLNSDSLQYRDFQLFMKRLRKRTSAKVRFFACGEYGDENLRPHFHALLYNLGFGDSKYVGRSLYESKTLDSIWQNGHCTFGQVTMQSAGYVAHYCQKKITGPLAERAYERVDFETGEITRVVPEFGHMSLKPGIGYPWFEKFWRDVYMARDAVVIDGKSLPVPKYYDKLLEVTCPQLSTDKEYDRYINSKQFEADCTPERLQAREVVALARRDLTKRYL